MELILSIDQGTTSSRAIIFDTDGTVLADERVELTQYYPKPGWVEQDADEILKSVVKVCGAVVEKLGDRSKDIVAAGITNQRESTVVWDRKSGRPLHRVIVWQCRRSSGICDEIKGEGVEPVIQEKTGLVVDPYFSATKLTWLLRNNDDLRKAAEKGQLCFGTIDSWLLYKLTGKHLTDFSNASRTLLFNIEKLDFDEDLLDIFGIPGGILPEPRPSISLFGNIEKKWFGIEVPVYGVAGDQQASLFGHGCFEPGMAKNTYGTGCFLLMNVGESPCISRRGLLGTVAWVNGNRRTYALEGSVFIAGAVVKWLRDMLGVIEDVSISEELARSIPDNGGVYFVPAFVGLGAPYWNADCRGLITGLTGGSGKAHVVRAALESICYQAWEIVKAMEEDSGVGLRELRVDGGVTENEFVMQFQSDILNKTVAKTYVTETTALGVALMAGMGCGIFNDFSDIKRVVKYEKKYEPQMNGDKRNELLDGWKKAVKRTLM